MNKILKYIFILTGILFPRVLLAQYAIPNGSFETWTGVNQPANWLVIQGNPTQGHVVNYAIIDSAMSTDTTTDTLHITRAAKNGGSYINMPMFDTTSPCIISQKFAMTQRPNYFSMNYAYFPETSGDQFQVGFLFTKWNTITHQEDTILAGDYNSSPGVLAQPWSTILKADLTTLYNPNTSVLPDSATIIITSSLQSSPYLKTLLLIDEIYFTDTAVTAGVKIPDNNFSQSSNTSVYPNPFSDKATITYNITQGGQVLLNVYDANGRLVSTLVNESQAPGNHEVVFDGSGLNEGVYIYKLQSDNGIQTGKLILSK